VRLELGFCTPLLASLGLSKTWAALACAGRRGVAARASFASEGGAGAEEAAAEPHIPVLLEPILEMFRGQHVRVYLDGTLGAGGHAAAIAQEHPEMELLIGLDQDPTAHREAGKKLDAVTGARGEGGAPLRVHMVQANFRDLASVIASLPPDVKELLGGGVDGMLFDLGVSSMQLDTAERGFSFMQDGPVDMRMNPDAALSAEVVVNTWTERELGRILREYGEEKRWKYIARRIVDAREEAGAITTTQQLVEAIGPAPPVRYGKKGSRRPKQIHPATRTFQALRIAVNDELKVVEEVLPDAIEALAPGGRLGVISFHSLEDRIVKTAFRTASGNPPQTDEEYSMMRYVPGVEAPKSVRILNRKVLVATDDEASWNPRSRSAKLRFVEKL